MVLINIIGNKTWCRPILSNYAYLCPANQASALQMSNFVNHKYDYRPNWTHSVLLP